MTEQSAADLKRRRKQLLRKLPPLDSVLRGSLIERYKRCGNPRCKCATGPGHGPKFYLSVSHAGESPQMDYVPQAEQALVSEYLANYSLVRETYITTAGMPRLGVDVVTELLKLSPDRRRCLRPGHRRGSGAL